MPKDIYLPTDWAIGITTGRSQFIKRSMTEDKTSAVAQTMGILVEKLYQEESYIESLEILLKHTIGRLKETTNEINKLYNLKDRVLKEINNGE